LKLIVVISVRMILMPRSPSPASSREILCQRATLSCEGAAGDGARNCQVQVRVKHLSQEYEDVLFSNFIIIIAAMHR